MKSVCGLPSGTTMRGKDIGDILERFETLGTNDSIVRDEEKQQSFSNNLNTKKGAYQK